MTVNALSFDMQMISGVNMGNRGDFLWGLMSGRYQISSSGHRQRDATLSEPTVMSLHTGSLQRASLDGVSCNVVLEMTLDLTRLALKWKWKSRVMV